MEEKNGDKSFLSEGKMKVLTDNLVILFNGKTNEIIMVDEQKKTYSRATPDEYCKTMSDMINQAKDHVPAEYRQMMEQMMKSKSKNTTSQVVSISNTGIQEKIAGLNTDKYKVTVNGDLYEEVYLATDTELKKDYEPLIPLMQKFSKCASASLNMMETLPENDPEYQKLIEKGFIVKSVSYKNGSHDASTDMMNLEKTTVPDSVFTVPSSYKKLDLAELLKSQMNMDEEE